MKALLAPYNLRAMSMMIVDPTNSADVSWTFLASQFGKRKHRMVEIVKSYGSSVKSHGVAVKSHGGGVKSHGESVGKWPYVRFQ